MTIDDEGAAKPAGEIVIGQDLDLLSVAELEIRIELLEAEIERIKADIAAKLDVKSAADAFFRK